MIVSDKHLEIRDLLDSHRAAGRRVSMVGTSGGTHAGHLSLVERARQDSDVVAVFWNGALQLEWAPASSVQSYTRSLERDSALLEAAGVDVIYVPVRDDLYRRPSFTFLTMPSMIDHLADMPEGQHMHILVTMVATLLNISGPCTTYFGEKDWPQLVIFQRMAEDLRLPSRVLAVPTVREADGVALSSRNAKLSPAARAQAPALYQALSEGIERIRSGERDAATVTEGIRRRLAEVSVPDYVKAVEADTLRPLQTLSGEVRLLASTTFDTTPLVDNLGISLEPAATAGEVSA